MKVSQVFSRKTGLYTLNFLLIVFPTVLTYAALLILVFTAIVQFFVQGKFLPVLTLYLTAIGITTALSSVTFAYARLKSEAERDYLTETGELFLWGSICLIVSLLTAWLTSEAKSFIAGYRYHEKIDTLLFFLFIGGQGYMGIAAGSINTGLVQLDSMLSTKLRHRRLYRIRPFHNRVGVPVSTSSAKSSEDL
jgi:hypothetical protein